MSEMNTRWRWFLRLGITYCGALGTAVAQIFAFSVNSTLAQELKPIADDSLGAESSVVTSINSQVDRIDGGAIRGTNLFHSFSQFHIGEGREAYFANPSGIENILSRVTGSDASKIFGKLGVLGNANLFLINPNGIIFGPKASLDIRGSFVASTANSFKFTDGFEFSATAPQATPLLTVSVPIGLQYGSNVRNIQVQESRLQVKTGQTLALVGGNVRVSGGELGFLQARGGRIELGGLGDAGMVNIEGQQSEGGFRVTSLRFPDAVERGDVLLNNFAFIDVRSGRGGNIAINARKLDVLGSSELRAGIGLGMGSPEATAGDITFNATGEITIGQSSRIQNAVAPNTVGNGGNININTGSLTVRNGALLSASTFGQGNAGNVIIDARDTVSLAENNTAIVSTVEEGVGKSGNLSINTRNFFITNGAQLASATRGRGDAGNVIINARDTISLNRGTIFSTVVGQGIGKGGDIRITTGELFLTNGAQLASATRGRGDAGNVIIDARNTVSLDGNNTIVASTVQDVSIGNGGDIRIATKDLFLTNGAQLTASTFGRGNAGNIQIRAYDTINISGTDSRRDPSGLLTFATSRATGKAGDITIDARNFRIADEAVLDARTANRTSSGNITVNVNSLEAINGGQLLTSSSGSGGAGDIKVSASQIRLDNLAQFKSESAFGDGGNITLQVKDLLYLRRGSLISTTAGTARRGGSGGNIIINAPNGFIVAVPNNNSDIIANAFNGNGGTIAINATGLFGIAPLSRQELEKLRPKDLASNRLPTNDITAISQQNPSLSGQISITTPDVDPNRGLVELPVNLVDASQQIAQSCTPRDGQTSRFVATGRGGLPLSPSEPLRSRAVVTQWVTLDEQTGNQGDGEVKPVESSEHPADDREPIVEANGWVVDKEGDVYLVAQVPNATSSFQTTTASCRTPN